MIIRHFKIRVPPNWQIGYTLFSSFLSNSVNRPHISRHMGLHVHDADNLIGPAPAGGPDLVHDYPRTLVPPFPVHQVPVSFRPTDGPDLVHDYSQNLVPPFPVHQVPVNFRPAAQISPGPPSDERRKAKRAEQRTGLRSALHIIIPKGKVMRGGPRALLLIISKEKN